jgi:glycosyltransferase involved in cell wall biosynthesis
LRIAVVIPALNEAATVEQVVVAAASVGTPVVVDDGSIDETAVRAEAAGAAVITHPRTRGYDAALASGFAWADANNFEAVATIDADAQHDPDLLATLLWPIEAGDAAMVLGVRAVPARSSERIFSAYVRTRFGVADILCGMKAFDIDVYRAHRETMELSSIGTALALAALRDRVTFATVLIPIRPRLGHARFGRGLRANGRILRALAQAILADLGHLMARR